VFDTVSIDLHCGDEYEAQSLYDEVVARLSRGEPLTLRLIKPEQVHDQQRGEK
jgi:hypothetical protein